MRTLACRIAWATALLLLPVVAAAQTGTIAGTVKDSSGAVLAGVSIEVTSPALIEKNRSAKTDGGGQYKIIQLPPGVYRITFALPGFNTVKRENVTLETDFTANISVDLRVGAVEETITVSAVAPLVDVQGTATRTVMTRDVLDTIPTGRNIQAAGIMIPGTSLSQGGGGALSRDVGGSGNLQQSPLQFRGSSDAVQTVEGMRLNNLCGNGAFSGVYWNDGSFQEVSYVTGADSAEMGQAGLRINMVPRDGGNTFRSSIIGKYSHGPWQENNLRSNLAGDVFYNPANSLTNISKIIKLYDFNPTIGGPLVRDRVWFNFTYRRQRVEKTVADSFKDANPLPYAYTPDITQPGIDDGYIVSNAARLTWQAGTKDKIAVYHDQQGKSRGHWGISALVSPDASAIQRIPLSFAHTTKWTRTQTNKLLFEGGFAMYDQEYIEDYQKAVLAGADVATTKVYSITEQGTNRVFSAWNNPADHYSILRTYSAAASYVTGSHALKFGSALSEGPRRTVVRYTGDLTMQFQNGLPQQVTLRLPIDQREGIKRDLGIYVQDRWTVRRATINGGLRYDNFVGQVIDEKLPESRWLGPNAILPGAARVAPSFDGFVVQNWKDLSPRVSVAVDLLGNGRTALKTSVGRFLSGEAVATAAANNPMTTISRTDTRNWNDLDGNFSIFSNDGSLQLAELGPTANTNFGKAVTTNDTSDQDILKGWYKRRYSWEYAASLQQQLSERMSAQANYYFRWEGNRTTQENTLIDNSSFDGPFCLTIPIDPLLGGSNQPECGLYDLKPAFRGLVQNNTTFSDTLGGRIDHTMGFDITMLARFSAGSFLQGGINMQRALSDTCAIQVDNPEDRVRVIGDGEAGRFCHIVAPYRPDFKMLGAYTMPGDVVLSGTYQFVRGPAKGAIFAARSDTFILPNLGRNLSACATLTGTCTSAKTLGTTAAPWGVVEPNASYGENLNQLDLRASKRFTIGRLRIRGDFDLYNVLNSNWPFTLNNTFSNTSTSNWLRPTNVLPGRMFELGGQIDF